MTSSFLKGASYGRTEVSCLRFTGPLIEHYREAFDRGVALVQLGFPAERIRRILEQAAAKTAYD
jgi:hypothetical protein